MLNLDESLKKFSNMAFCIFPDELNKGKLEL